MNEKVRLYIENKPVQLISSVVEKNGTRAVDAGRFVIPRKYTINKGDQFQYLQDVISPKYLVGLWNMEHNTRDESGYNIDGDETTSAIHQGSFDDGADGYYYKNGSSGRCIKVAHNSHLDFSGQFDIILLLGNITGYPNSTTSYLFGKGTSTNSIELSTTSGSSNTTPMYLKLDMKIGGSTTSITGNIDVNRNNGNVNSGNMQNFRWIRIKRDSNNLVTLSVDNISHGTATIAGDCTTTEPLYIAGNRSGTSIADDNFRFAQLRIYTGDSLTDDNYKILISSRRPTEVMKFGGTVWKIDEKSTHKVCYCKGLSDKLHNVEVSNSGYSNFPTWTTGDSDIEKNHYYNKDGRDILEDLIDVYDLGINIATINDNLTTSFSQYHAVGSLLSNILLLTMCGNTDASFHITPRGTLLLEDDDISHDKILFKQGAKARIHDFGVDDTNLITHLTLLADTSPIEGVLNNTVSDWSSTLTSGEGYEQTANLMRGKPITIQVTDPNGVELERKGASDNEPIWSKISGAPSSTQFKVDFYSKKIWLGARVSGTYIIKYTYIDAFNLHKQYSTKSSTFATEGMYSKTMHLPQLTGSITSSGVNLPTIALRILNRFNTSNRRVTITVPTLINHIRENYEVEVEDPDHGVSENANSTYTTEYGRNTKPISLSVKSIIYYYPEGKTVINCGEHMFDSYDLDKAFGESISTQKANIVNTPV